MAGCGDAGPTLVDSESIPQAPVSPSAREPIRGARAIVYVLGASFAKDPHDVDERGSENWVQSPRPGSPRVAEISGPARDHKTRLCCIKKRVARVFVQSRTLPGRFGHIFGRPPRFRLRAHVARPPKQPSTHRIPPTHRVYVVRALCCSIGSFRRLLCTALPRSVLASR